MPLLDRNVDDTFNAKIIHDSFTNLVENSYSSAYLMIEKQRKSVDKDKPYINRELKCLTHEKRRIKNVPTAFPLPLA